jgi:hypothetical protein
VRPDGSLARRCRLHGGLSTGPRTPEGRARSIAALFAGLLQWRLRRQARTASWRAPLAET